MLKGVKRRTNKEEKFIDYFDDCQK